MKHSLLGDYVSIRFSPHIARTRVHFTQCVLASLCALISWENNWGNTGLLENKYEFEYLTSFGYWGSAIQEVPRISRVVVLIVGRGRGLWFILGLVRRVVRLIRF